ncbi:MAG: hypothetical protein NTZ65_04120 [Candidatus Berkelbacteria bacterium]|nr:hypothetical protein [Candidatus Berkelbacteria bacterium]
MTEKYRQFAAGQNAVNNLLSGKYSLTRAMKPPAKKILGCIDDGIEEAQSRAAGSYILLGEDEAMKLVWQNGFEYIGFHDDCGAVKKYLEDKGVFEPSSEQVNQESKRWAKRLAQLTKCKAKKMELTRGHHHEARIAYYDGTGKMTSTMGLPKGFIISRGVLRRDYACSEMVTATDIAFNHGFNELYSPERSFIWAALGKDQNHAAELEGELKPILSRLTHFELGAIKVIAISL